MRLRAFLEGRRASSLMRRFSVSNTVLLIICLMYLILYVDRVNISTAAPLIKADLDLTNTQLGLAFSAFAYPYALLQLIGGYIGDKIGPRLTLCVSSLIVCVATAATGVVGGSPVYSRPGLLWVSAKAPHSRLPLAP